MTARTYASPEAFKQALEQRLRAASTTGAEFARRRQLLVFDRFLAVLVVYILTSRTYSLKMQWGEDRRLELTPPASVSSASLR